MSNPSRKMRRRASATGRCPNCLERPTDHVVPLPGGYRLAACIECWPELLDQLRSDGFTVSGCVGPCCNS